MSEFDHKSRLASNIIYNMAAVFISSVCLFVGTWAIIHFFGKETHGEITWIMSISWVLCLISDLGLAGNAGVRTIARFRANEPEKLSESISLMFFVPMIMAVVLAGGLAAFYKPISNYKPGLLPVFIILAAVWVVTRTLMRVCRAVAVGFENLKDTLFMQSTAEVLKVIVVFGCWAAAMSVGWLFWGWTAAMLIAMGLSLWRVGRLAGRFGFGLVNPGLKLSGVAEAVWRSFPYYLPMLGMMGLPFVAPLLTDAFFKGSPDQASIATSVVNVLLSWALTTRLAALPISTSLLPRLTHINAGDRDTSQIATVIDQATRFMGIISVVMITVYIIAGKWLLSLIYADIYGESIATLLWFVPAIAADSYAMILDQILMADRHVKVVAIMEIVKYALMVVLAWWLTPLYGTLGVAMAVTAAMLVSAGVKIIPSFRKLSNVGIYPFIATMVCCAALGAAGAIFNRWWAIIIVFAVVTLTSRLLRPAELMQWAKILAVTVRGKRVDKS